jgi:hypothetical protein
MLVRLDDVKASILPKLERNLDEINEEWDAI